MKDFYLWRVIRDLSYSASAVYIAYYIVSTMTMDRDFSLGEMFFVLFLFLGLIFIIAEIEDEYVAISKIDTVEILRNPGHPDKKGHAIDLSEILKHAHEFAEECQAHEAKSSDVGSTSESVKKRRAPNAGKKMSEEQKAKISASLKKMNAQKRATAKKAVNLKK